MLMRVVSVIFINTLREGLRKNFLIGLLLTCFIVLCLSLLFAQLSLDDKGRLTVNFGLAAVQLLLVALSVFFGSGFIAGDLDKKILWTILTRPVRPSVFFFGRYLGLACLLSLALVVLSVLLMMFFVFLKIPIQVILFYTLFGFLLESLLLLAFVIFCSSYYSSHFLVLFYCVSMFIIGHFLESLLYFINRVEGVWGVILSKLLLFLPDLEKINWKSVVVYQESIPFTEFSISSLYIVSWIGFILSLALLIMEKREYD